MEPWSELDTTTWLVVGEESRGKRTKVWVEDPEGDRWLRKEPRDSRPFEPAVEAIALRLARAAGLSAPSSHVSRWRDRSGNEHRGILVQLFVDEDETLSLGSEELASEGDYEAEDHGAHTVERVLQRLRGLGAPGSACVEDFLRVVLFDAWIGNGDRHQENWGLIRRAGTAPRLTPIFDPMPSMGVELFDEASIARALIRLNNYVLKCPSGFGAGRGGGTLRQPAVLAAARKAPEWANCCRLLADFERVLNTIPVFLETVPSTWLTDKRASFALASLTARLQWLRGLA